MIFAALKLAAMVGGVVLGYRSVKRVAQPTPDTTSTNNPLTEKLKEIKSIVQDRRRYPNTLRIKLLRVKTREAFIIGYGQVGRAITWMVFTATVARIVFPYLWMWLVFRFLCGLFGTGKTILLYLLFFLWKNSHKPSIQTHVPVYA